LYQNRKVSIGPQKPAAVRHSVREREPENVQGGGAWRVCGEISLSANSPVPFSMR
jgi:hypothetical protein